MTELIRNLTSLTSIEGYEVAHLNTLDIYNVGDLLSHKPFRSAQLIELAFNKELNKNDILLYLNDRKSIKEKELNEIFMSSIENIKGVGDSNVDIYNLLGINTIYDASKYPPFLEAQDIINEALLGEEDPHAPECLIPKCKKFSKNSKNFVSFFKEKEIRDMNVICTNRYSLLSNLFNFHMEEPTIYLGYTVAYRQEWIYEGIHLGEPIGSVPLFMGEDTKVAKISWQRINRAIREENTQVAEELHNILIHNRAVDEVARATADEHQHGATASVAANAATAESFVAAGAIVGGVGGGITGAITGLVVGNVANAAAGAPTIAGTIAGTAIGSAAGAAAGSMVYSGALALGFVESDAKGDRNMYANSAQRIQERTEQNSSSIRSFWSNIITETIEKENQEINTRRLTNYNKIHALNGIYYEILNEYAINIKANDYKANIFIPFKPFTFTEDTIFQYWWIIKQYLSDKNLIELLDQRYISTNSSADSRYEIESLPDIDIIKTRYLEVKLDVNGSVMESLLGAVAFGSTFTLATVLNLSSIKVNVESDAGIFPLYFDSIDTNYIITFKTTVEIPITKINSISITNSSFEFFGINKTRFANAKIRCYVKNKGKLEKFLPDIGHLEVNHYLYGDDFEIEAGKSMNFEWVVVSDIKSQYSEAKETEEQRHDAIKEIEQIDRKIANFIYFLNANRYTFTRLILQGVESEQMAHILNDVEVGGIPVNTFADVNPVGFTGNHIVLELKKPVNALHYSGSFKIPVDKLRFALMPLESLESSRNTNLEHFSQISIKSNSKKNKNTILNNLGTYIDAIEDSINDILKNLKQITEPSYKERKFITKIKKLIPLIKEVKTFNNTTNNIQVKNIITEIADVSMDIQFFIKNIRHFRLEEERLDMIFQYSHDIEETFSDKIDEIISTSTVSLPSPALFLEPILSNAKGAELYDMRRNSHYEIKPASKIGTTDPNVSRSENIQLTPNQPQSNLNLITPSQYPLPNTINTALAEAGKLNLDTMISSNASTLSTTLTNLSNLATELAKASTQLTGDAQKDAISAANDITKQIGNVIDSSLKNPPSGGTHHDSTMTPQPEDQRVPAPKTAQEKAEVGRELRRIAESHANPRDKKKLKDNITPANQPEEDYDNPDDVQEIFSKFENDFNLLLLSHKNRVTNVIANFQDIMELENSDFDGFDISLAFFDIGLNLVKLIPDLKVAATVLKSILDVYKLIDSYIKNQLTIANVENLTAFVTQIRTQISNSEINLKISEMLFDKWSNITNVNNANQFVDYFRQNAAIDDIKNSLPNTNELMLDFTCTFMNYIYKSHPHTVEPIAEYFGVIQVEIKQDGRIEACNINLINSSSKYSNNIKKILFDYGAVDNKLNINNLKCYKHIITEIPGRHVEFDPYNNIIVDLSGYDFTKEFPNGIPKISKEICQ